MRLENSDIRGRHSRSCEGALEIVAEIFRDLLIFVGAMFVLFVALIVIVSKLGDENPLKRILSALAYRAAATLAVGAVALPIEFVPGIDALYDIAAPIGLAWFWYTFFRDLYRGAAWKAPQPSSKPVKVQIR